MQSFSPYSRPTESESVFPKNPRKFRCTLKIELLCLSQEKKGPHHTSPEVPAFKGPHPLGKLQQSDFNNKRPECCSSWDTPAPVSLATKGVTSIQTSQGRWRSLLRLSLLCLNSFSLGAELLFAEEMNGQPCENVLQIARCDLIVGVIQ